MTLQVITSQIVLASHIYSSRPISVVNSFSSTKILQSMFQRQNWFKLWPWPGSALWLALRSSKLIPTWDRSFFSHSGNDLQFSANCILFYHCGQASVYLALEKQRCITCNSCLGRQTSSLQRSSLFFFPSFICWARCNIVWNIPLVSWGSAVLAVLPPSFLCTHSLLTGEAVWDTDNVFFLCKCCSTLTKTSLHY